MIGALRGTLALLVLVLLVALSPARAETPDEALDALLAKVRSEMPEACDKEDADTLVRILCTGTMRVGVRWNYPMFSTLVGDTDERIGYDTAVAGAIAARLGVTPEWVHVRAATRISTLAEGGADVVIATMGHTKQRDGQTRYIRPHYYSSETIVVGPRELDVSGWDDIKGWRVCSTIGNHANSYLVTKDVRLMLFESAVRLPEALEDGTCRLASQDDSFFASFIAVPEFGARFERKFGFHAVPWGMAVAQTGSDEFATALELISAIMHRDGEFLELGIENSVFTGFLEEQHDKWQTPTCADASAIADAGCVLPALDNTPLPTRFADEVNATVEWIKANLGLSLELPMLTSVPAFELFTAGIVNSLILVMGALGATLGFSLIFGFFSIIPLRVSRFVTWGIVTTIQSSPVILTLVVAGTVATTIFTYSPAVALGSAIVALGLMNGANAGQAIGEAAESLQRDGRYGSGFSGALYWAAVRRSLTQLLSFLINAAKGTPIASFTGAPELLSALTDITSFSAGRGTMYTMVLIFYIAVVFLVVWACERVRTRLNKREEAQA
ncbi:transporter substrate-binding domain-containing protein [Hoeflea sp. WL0058]|uniref:Transporter substrate-binding domain-containing protein n=1 Tax=Flavimaribacter sediminis TaxID=2865987 RepID=A0AAE2ZRY2_9HYPH|nr:transporter substrate-binding domain-containing protein [Flavimaribacter sediminis]MBW8639700.1 transporter substrate-binding domain-containing protein [Flavimaribacter sediminis]